MEAVKRRDQRVVTQPVEDREPQAGWQPVLPYTTLTAPVTVNEDVEDISIRKAVHHEQLSFEEEACFLRQTSVASTASSSCSASDDDSNMVVDMRQTLQFHNSVRVRRSGLSERDVGISIREEHGTCRVDDDLADLQIIEEVDEPTKKLKGYVACGDDNDIRNLLKEKPTQKGIICCPQILHCEDGVYKEGLQYKIIPGTESKGAYGEAAMCQDQNTSKTFMLKKVQGKLYENEIEVPVMFRGNAGIPEVYGVIMEDNKTLIFQEFAGMSLKKVNESEYVGQLRDPRMVMLLGFQGFVTLGRLHSQGVSHQDVKPENLCVDTQAKRWCLKLIDFGSSQTAQDIVTEGLTNEYLSPESCRNILLVAKGQLTKEQGRLGPGTDVWAMALSLLYCLCGYHVMVYACTGDTMYRETDPQKLQAKRIQCVFQICNMTDADIAKKLIRADWPEPLRVLLLNTLRVNPQERWTAKQAAYYICTEWIMKGGSASMEPKVKSAPSSGFTGLTPPRLVVQTQAAFPQRTSQGAQNGSSDKMPARQCTAPSCSTPPAQSTETSPSAQLPAFMDLLSDGLSKLKLRPYKRKQQRDGPYTAVRRGSKVMKK